MRHLLALFTKVVKPFLESMLVAHHKSGRSEPRSRYHAVSSHESGQKQVGLEGCPCSRNVLTYDPTAPGEEWLGSVPYILGTMAASVRNDLSMCLRPYTVSHCFAAVYRLFRAILEVGSNSTSGVTPKFQPVFIRVSHFRLKSKTKKLDLLLKTYSKTTRTSAPGPGG
jgi:hypothetical protein